MNSRIIFSDRSLATLLEMSEAHEYVECAELASHIFPDTTTSVRKIATGYAAFAGYRLRRFNRAIGLGMEGPVSSSDIDDIEDFYHNFGLPSSIVVCPLADRSLISLLNTRQYGPELFYNVLYKVLKHGDCAEPRLPNFDISSGNLNDFSSESIAAAFGLDEAGSRETWESYWATFSRPSVRIFIAYLNGRPIGGGAAHIRGELATLFGSRTHPSYRRRGVHNAIINARLAFASSKGCQLAALLAVPGGPSQKNHERAGFQIAYTRLVVRKG